MDSNGQDLIEYALLAGLVAVAVGSIMPGVATDVSKIFSKVSSVMLAAPTQGSFPDRFHPNGLHRQSALRSPEQAHVLAAQPNSCRSSPREADAERAHRELSMSAAR